MNALAKLNSIKMDLGVIDIVMVTAKGETSQKLKGFQLIPTTTWSNHFSR